MSRRLLTPRLLTTTSRLSSPWSGRSVGCSILSLRSCPREVTAIPDDLHAVVASSPIARTAMMATLRYCLRFIQYSFIAESAAVVSDSALTACYLQGTDRGRTY